MDIVTPESFWPPLPEFKPIAAPERPKVWGYLSCRPAATESNPEALVITNHWDRDNIIRVEIPQLAAVKGTQGQKFFQFHKKMAHLAKQLFVDWDDAGLMPLVLTWGGSWAPRFVRQSRFMLSNHAYGTAFDINAAWNGLGKRPASLGHEGSVVKLVELANRNGFFWGGHFVDFKGRYDGMHFEFADLTLLAPDNPY